MYECRADCLREIKLPSGATPTRCMSETTGLPDEGRVRLFLPPPEHRRGGKISLVAGVIGAWMAKQGKRERTACLRHSYSIRGWDAERWASTRCIPQHGPV